MSAPHSPGTDRLAPARQLGIQRMAMLAGVLIFGAVIYYTRDHRVAAPHPGLQLPLVAVWIGACALVILCMARLRATRDEKQLNTFSLVGWTASEAPALLGAVYYMLTDDPRWYAAGLVLMAMTFIAIPLRRT